MSRIKNENKEKIETKLNNMPTFKAYCHTFRVIKGVMSAFSICGVPRAEQSRHGVLRKINSALYETHCKVCALERCPKCKKGG